jgi:cell division protein FtsZ
VVATGLDRALGVEDADVGIAHDRAGQSPLRTLQ